jgi:hypothetical protein
VEARASESNPHYQNQKTIIEMHDAKLPVPISIVNHPTLYKNREHSYSTFGVKGKRGFFDP